MKRYFLLLAMLAVVACSKPQVRPAIIFDTDIGNDIDDAEALDLLFKYLDEGKIDLLGICLNKTGDATVKYVDIMQTWYGHQDVPLGLIRTDKPTGWIADSCYTGRVGNLKDENGNDLFQTSGIVADSLPEAYRLYRKLLSEAEDNSVTILSVGFFSNLALLMESQSDDISPLSGMELISAKVNKLVIMAGRFDVEVPEFNVQVDIPSSQKIFSTWPTEMAVLTWELGDKVHYPAESIENDFNWTLAHPLKEAYIRFMPMPFNNTMFDPTAVVYAAGDTCMFTAGPYGRVDVDSTGISRFTEGEGKTRVMYLTDEQASNLLDYFISYLTRKPKSQS